MELIRHLNVANVSPRQQRCFVARQPVFTTQGAVWGYELLFREHADAEHYNPFAGAAEDSLKATAQIIVDGLALAFSGTGRPTKALLNIPPAFWGAGLLETLPSDRCVLEILEYTQPTQEMLKHLQRFKKRGYTLALDDYAGQERLAPFLPLMDVVKVDFRETGREDLAALTRSLAHPRRMLLAEKVETREEAEEAKRLGYHLLQGFYFQKPEILSGRKAAASQTSRIRVLGLLMAEEPDRKRLEHFFVQNPQLLYRLLKFANSAFFSPPRKLNSLRHAFSFLGTERLRRWLITVLLADGNGEDCQSELAFMGAVRACFLLNIAKTLRVSNEDNMFMTGLLSLLDTIYGMPFHDLMQDIPLAKEVIAALCNGEGTLAQWLEVAVQMERGQFKDSMLALESLGVRSKPEAVICHRKAVDWVRAIMTSDAELAGAPLHW